MNSHDIFVENKFRQVSKLIPENSKILDIGCGDGNIRNFLKNPDYYGIDGDKDLIVELNKQKVKAKWADLNKDKLAFKKDKFDFFFYWMFWNMWLIQRNL